MSERVKFGNYASAFYFEFGKTPKITQQTSQWRTHLDRDTLAAITELLGKVIVTYI